MIINTDKEGKELIVQLCDIALKMGGLQNLQGVNNILQTIKLVEEEEQVIKEV